MRRVILTLALVGLLLGAARLTLGTPDVVQALTFFGGGIPTQEASKAVMTCLAWIVIIVAASGLLVGLDSDHQPGTRHTQACSASGNAPGCEPGPACRRHRSPFDASDVGVLRIQRGGHERGDSTCFNETPARYAVILLVDDDAVAEALIRLLVDLCTDAARLTVHRPPVQGIGFFADGVAQRQVDAWWDAEVPIDVPPLFVVDHSAGIPDWLGGLRRALLRGDQVGGGQPLSIPTRPTSSWSRRVASSTMPPRS